MAHDPLLERRLDDALKAQGAKAEPKKMFGGVAFMVNGNMCVGVTNKSDLMVRFAPGRHAEIRKWPGAKPMTFGKGDTKGFLFVDPATVTDRKALDRWVRLSLEHVSSLPKKAVARKASTRKPALRTSSTRIRAKAAKKR